MPSAKIVYVMSRSHSGSTLLDLLLSTHERVVSVGEAKLFPRLPDKTCTCGADNYRVCPFWSEVDGRMRADGGAGIGSPDIESDDDPTFTTYNRRFFDAVSAVSGAPVVVDSSKSLARLERYRRSGLPVHVLHLMRHPCGVVNSNMRNGGRLNRECRLYVREHLGAAYALRGMAHTEVRYEDLAGDPERELRRLATALGLEFDSRQLREWKARERHNFGGNRMRFDPSEEIRVDERWRDDLAAWQKALIRVRTSPVLARRGPGLRVARAVSKLL